MFFIPDLNKLILFDVNLFISHDHDLLPRELLHLCQNSVDLQTVLHLIGLRKQLLLLVHKVP